MKEEWTDILNILIRTKTYEDLTDYNTLKKLSKLLRWNTNMKLLGELQVK